ncbi:MAG: site-2 protease family protein [Clostridiales Family XIII bacterium]|jgi:Zn-dependent protease|nr:site-2 protease family protein [Clostridiales Family XIII bacterium]
MRRFFGNNFALIFMLILVARAVTRGTIFNDPLGWLIDELLILPGIIIGITFHEFAHAFAAYKLGDKTPKAQGRVTLNPLAHIDPVGLIALLFIGFGWGRPVMVNPYAFKHMRRDNLITDVAGIVTNFTLAFVFMGVMKLFLTATGAAAYSSVLHYTALVIVYIIWMNLVLMIFNLLPVPPLDGFGIVTEIFDLRGKPFYEKLYYAGTPILIVLIILNVPSRVISPIIEFLYGFLEGIFF